MSDFASLEEIAESAIDSSPLGRIRQRRRELEAGVFLDVPVPGYHGELVARYPKITPEDLRIAGQEAAATRGKNADAALTAAANIVTRYVREVCIVEPDGSYLSLNQDDPEPLRFDARLARAMNVESPESLNQRQVLFKVLGRGNEAGAQGMAGVLLAWWAGLSEEARETLEGESRATLP